MEIDLYLEFRAWDIKNKVMTEVIDIAFDPEVFIRCYNPVDDKCWELHGGEFILEQYIGRRDKRGIKMYEGDVAEMSSYDYEVGSGEKIRTYYHVGQIKYDESSQGYRFVCGSMVLKVTEEMEVIGHIHQSGYDLPTNAELTLF